MTENMLNTDRSLAAYGKYLEQAIPSGEICTYLKEKNHSSVADIIDIIYYSPVMFLNEKRDAIASVLAEINDDTSKLSRKCKDFLFYINKAMELLQMQCIFTLETMKFNTQIGEQEGCFEGVYASYHDVLDEVRRLEEDDYWFEVKLWDKNHNGKMRELATYILVKGRPMYCDLEEEICKQIEGIDENNNYSFRMISMTDLNIAIPYKPGDIVEVGSAPFVPRYKILITEVGDNYDCCCVQGMRVSKDGQCITGAVKHGHVGYAKSSCYILPSLLYEMNLYNGKLGEAENILREVSFIIKRKTSEMS